MLWNIVTLLMAALASLGVILAPLLTLGALATCLVAALFLFRPKLAVGFTVLMVMLGTGLETATSISALGYVDEILVLASVVAFTGRRLLSGLPPRMLRGSGWLAIFILLGITSCVLRDVPGILAAQSLFLTLKGFIFAFAVAQLDWTPKDARKMAKPAAATLVFVLLTSVINLAIPGLWTNTFGRAEAGVSYRLGLPSLIGPFDHPVAYGQFMALAIAALVAYRANIRKSKGSTFLLVASLAGVILSFRRKAIIATAAAAFTARSLSPGKRLSTSLAVLLILPAAVFFSWDSLTAIIQFTYSEYFLNPTEAARTLLYRGSLTLGLAYFPFGAGFGRFGSFSASQSYSPEYVNLGYGSVYRMGPGDKGGFLSDTFWPAILGETGFFGLLAFAIALIMLARTGSKLVRITKDPYVRCLGIICVAWFIEFTIESVAAPSFNSPPLYTLLFAAAGVVTSLLAAERENGGQDATQKIRKSEPAR